MCAVTNGRPAIRLVGVSKQYGGHDALRPTDLEISEGDKPALKGGDHRTGMYL